jgi:hypothetical protein
MRDIRVLTQDEAKDIAYILEDMVDHKFHDAIMQVIGIDYDEIADESIHEIKKELAKAFY